jgi:peptidoglycan hydrolase CwlO-like protein
MFIFLLVFSFCLNPRPLLAQCADSQDCEVKVQFYTQKLVELAQAKDTLSQQIAILNSQINLTLVKISQTQNNITVLKQDIQVLAGKISQLDTLLDHLSSIFINLINKSYRLQITQFPLDSLLNQNFNRFLQGQKYLFVVNHQIQNSLVQYESTRTDLDHQKVLKLDKQSQLEVLEKKLNDQKLSLGQQKNSKSNLLAVTKNDETRYQQLKKAAQDELTSLLKAKFVGKRQVRRGDAIGMMGNTGYSFGDHLHFSLYQLSESEIDSWLYQNDLNPSEYLAGHIFPMDQPLKITQTRGHTPYSYLYSDHFHHGIDFVSANKIIRAVNDGQAYFYQNTQSSLGNHVKIFHADGKMTLYLHLQ